jgi:hypothetical protein
MWTSMMSGTDCFGDCAIHHSDSEIKKHTNDNRIFDGHPSGYATRTHSK